jgi:hypothetical protein
LFYAEKVARVMDPERWASLTSAGRRKLVAKVYEQSLARLKADNLLKRTIRPR